MVENTSDEEQPTSALLIELRPGGTTSTLAPAAKVAPPPLSRVHIWPTLPNMGVDDEG
jgi:hypothetical protein